MKHYLRSLVLRLWRDMLESRLAEQITLEASYRRSLRNVNEKEAEAHSPGGTPLTSDKQIMTRHVRNTVAEDLPRLQARIQRNQTRLARVIEQQMLIGR